METIFDEIDLVDLQSVECLICYEPCVFPSIKQLECHHIFHIKCIDKWLQKNPNCPLCRKHILVVPLRSIVTETSSNSVDIPSNDTIPNRFCSLIVILLTAFILFFIFVDITFHFKN